MSDSKEGGGLKVPPAMVIAFVMYILTSTPAAIWFAADIQGRVKFLEQQTQGVPTRIAVLESRMGDVVDLLRQIRDKLPQGRQ